VTLAGLEKLSALTKLQHLSLLNTGSHARIACLLILKDEAYYKKIALCDCMASPTQSSSSLLTPTFRNTRQSGLQDIKVRQAMPLSKECEVLVS